ncbi:MAG TPA: bifunctional riboflavin kinase/FAD synthetase [Candidatus Binatia bacterium]|nr:bifunctional riboflavin kinase/FAD synthetase [Candidatus Binatia bacterium]
MRTIRGLESYPPDAGPTAVALGVFDGVHLGHRAILARAVERGRQVGVTPVACTFDPHPLEVLQPDQAPVPISDLEERLSLIADTGIETTLVLAFTAELAAMAAEAFVKEVLLDRLQAREVVVGFNHRFGRGARGDPALLQALGERLGFQAHVVPPLTVEGVTVSSSGIRKALQEGDVERAARWLGHPYTLVGVVERGAGRGHGLGFPTANVRPTRPPLVPTGVYAAQLLLGRGVAAPAVVNIGVRPTFGESRLVVEAHVLDFSGDLYGQTVRLALLRRLREERRFPDVDALRRQIAADVAEARRQLGAADFTSP